VWMMTTRERELDAIRAVRPRQVDEEQVLGDAAEIRKRLPLAVEFGGAQYRLIELDGELVAYSARCPHLLGPLGEAMVEGGTVECPWHGYRFDVLTRKCVSGANCMLAPAPSVRVDPAGQVVLGPT
jgi:nitrite reductase/ring-hydroxylating ferredoxin subunit